MGDMFSMVGAQSYGRSTPKNVTFISVNEASTSYDLEVMKLLNSPCNIYLNCIVNAMITDG